MRGWKSVGIVLLGCIAIPGGMARVGAQTAAGSPQFALPPDVYPESRSRLPLPKREDMDEEGKRVWDKLLDPSRPSLAGLMGPIGIRLWSPRVAESLSDANAYLRSETGFGPRLTEIAILTTAREMDNQFEWTAHEISGLKAGVEPAIIDLIKYRRPITGLGEKETVIIRLGRELFAQRKVSSDTFAATLRLFGRKGVVDLISLMANYSATAALLNAVDMQLPEGQEPLLPLP